MNGTVIYKQELYEFKFDEKWELWVKRPSKISQKSFGRFTPIYNLEDARALVIEMLLKAGY